MLFKLACSTTQAIAAAELQAMWASPAFLAKKRSLVAESVSVATLAQDMLVEPVPLLADVRYRTAPRLGDHNDQHGLAGSWELCVQFDTSTHPHLAGCASKDVSSPQSGVRAQRSVIVGASGRREAAQLYTAVSRTGGCVSRSPPNQQLKQYAVMGAPH